MTGLNSNYEKKDNLKLGFELKPGVLDPEADNMPRFPFSSALWFGSVSLPSFTFFKIFSWCDALCIKLFEVLLMAKGDCHLRYGFQM